MGQIEVIFASRRKVYHAGRYWSVSRKIQATSQWRQDARHVWAYDPASYPSLSPAGTGVCRLTNVFSIGADRHYLRFFWDGKLL